MYSGQYINNKTQYRELKLLKYGGKIKYFDNNGHFTGHIIKELGKGHSGTTYLVEINKKTYALKRQKITNDAYKNIKSTAIPINRELIFFTWVNELPTKDKLFFMELFDYQRYECDFDFIPIRGAVSDELQKSSYCQDLIVSRKDGTIETLINHMTENPKNKIASLFLQIVYGIYLMHGSGYYHFDTKLDNICYVETKKKYVKLGKFGKIKTFGRIFSIIDYGLVLNDSFEMNENETMMYQANKILNSDLFLLIEYVLMNNVKIYSQIGGNHNQNIGIKPINVYEIIKTINPKTYDSVIQWIDNDMGGLDFIRDFDVFLQNGGTYDELKKIPRYKGIMYEIMHVYQLKYENEYYESLNKYFNTSIKKNHLLFTADEILFVKTHRDDTNEIIKKFSQYVK